LWYPYKRTRNADVQAGRFWQSKYFERISKFVIILPNGLIKFDMSLAKPTAVVLNELFIAEIVWLVPRMKSWKI
jgi:hypothetical protein